MKHLQSYKIFESNVLDTKSIRENVMDIFLDLRDIGFKINFKIDNIDVNHVKKTPSYRFEFRIEMVDLENSDVDDESPYTIDFDSKLIREDITRLTDYLKSLSIGFGDEVDYMNEINYSLFTMPSIRFVKSLDEFINYDGSEEIYVFRLDGWIHL